MSPADFALALDRWTVAVAPAARVEQEEGAAARDAGGLQRDRPRRRAVVRELQRLELHQVQRAGAVDVDHFLSRGGRWAR